MPPSQSCASCFSTFSQQCHASKLPNCNHTICYRCIEKATTKGSCCPVCRAPFGLWGSKPVDAPSNHQHGASLQAHIIGHSWIVEMRESSFFNRSTDISFSFRRISDSAFPEITAIAKSGGLKQHKNVVVFACIPLAWRIHRPPNFPGLVLFLPNMTFSHKELRVQIKSLIDALTSHRPDAQLFMFLPPLLDVNNYNQHQIKNANLQYSDVIQSCPQIKQCYILSHSRNYVSELHFQNFANQPSNVHMIYGHSVSLSASSTVGDNMMAFIRGKTNTIALEDLFINGVKPSKKYLSALFSSLALKIKTVSAKGYANISSENSSRSSLESTAQAKSAGGSLRQGKSTLAGESPSQQSIKDAKELPACDSQHLLDAVREEIQRSVDYLRTVRDLAYPTVTNKQLAEAAQKAVKNCIKNY